MNLGIRSRVTQCEGKRPYATRDDAVKWRKRMRGLEPYRCPHCGQFHLGTRPKGTGRPKPPPPAIELEF